MHWPHHTYIAVRVHITQLSSDLGILIDHRVSLVLAAGRIDNESIPRATMSVQMSKISPSGAVCKEGRLNETNKKEKHTNIGDSFRVLIGIMGFQMTYF